jgi:hypothetical protein
MVLRIEQWLGGSEVGQVDLWLGLRLGYGLWQARKHAPKAIRRARVEAAV